MRERGENGAATVVALAMLGVLVLVGAALGVVVAIVHAHRQAQSAADLAALAAASVLRRGGDACATAARMARANRARLDVCEVSGREVVVEVTVTGPHWLGQTEDLRARARAGPT